MENPKSRPPGNAQEAASDARRISKTVMDSAQQIWLAGLGAFAKAQQEGGKLFESLVKEGSALDARTRKYTETSVNEARGNVEGMLGQIRERGQATLGTLEKAFEDRVSSALGHLGIPRHSELESLTRRVEELAREVRRLGDKPATAKRPATKRARK